MANISKIKIGNNTYDIKDTQLRSDIIGKQPQRLGVSNSDTGTGTKGNTQSITRAVDGLFFGTISNTVGSSCMMIGTWHHPLTKDTETQYVSMSMGYDNGTSRIGKAYFQVTSGKTGKFVGGSIHNLETSGNPGTAIETINSFGGLL